MKMNKGVSGLFVVLGAAMVIGGAWWYLSAGDDPNDVDAAAASLGGPILIATGAFFLVMIVAMHLYARNRNARAANGKPAMATLISARDTGTMINNMPRLELELEIRPEDGRTPYRVTAKRTVGYGSLGSMQPGATFPVSVDVDKPDRFEFIDRDQYVSMGGAATSRSSPTSAAASTDAELLERLLTPEVLANATIVRDGAPVNSADDDPIAKLERLAALHRSGALTDAEFEAQKSRLLG